jgi:shikimate dehydrogenase
MKYGLIGEKLGHSYSKEIHSYLADYEYELCEVAREDISSFMQRGDFKAINVTIPYKQTVIPYLHYIDEGAGAIGAVNTVVNKDGLLYGYNTDFFGLKSLIERIGVSLNGKKVIILGTGGTSKTASAVAHALGAREILRISRSAKENSVSYEELYEKHLDAEYIINTTPSGMYPDIFNTPIDISKFPKLSGVADAVYNPLRTPLVLSAKERNIPAEGGLYMLVAQAVKASEYFIDTKYSSEVISEIYNKISGRKENIVLIGMPASGKSTVGKLVSDITSREFVDTDELIVKRAGMEITEIFSRFGEQHFRELETQIIKEISAKSSLIIATGGGAILRKENNDALKENGRLYFIDRPLEKLIPTASRPLSSDRKAIEKRFNERYGIYRSVCDVHINADTSPEEVAERILKG